MRLIGTDAKRHYAWELKPGRYSIGRKVKGTDCDFLIADMTVSRHHAELEISRDEKSCFLTDLNSHNGTLLNGNKISTRTVVNPGDHIQFGGSEFRLVDESTSAISPPRPTWTQLSEQDPEKSVVLSIDEALKPLPSQVADLPELLPTLFDMAKMLVLPEPKETMLERSLELVGKIVPSERLAVLFISDEQNEVESGVCHLMGKKDLGNVTLSRTILEDILTSKNSILIVDAKEDPRFAGQESIIMSEMKSAMAVPLLDEEKVLGILYADTSSPLHRYNDDYLRLFAMIGHILASRLTNYTLIKERQEKQIFEAELLRASLIQKGLLPSATPELPGYKIHAYQEQCRSVGGDLYDMELLPDGRLLFLLADVSGKGMGAALLMSNILASFRILYDSKDFDLTGAVNHVSSQLFKHSPPESFATLFVGIINPQTHKMCFINAGHNPPLLIREDGRFDMLEASGTMIGAFDMSGWTEEETNFNPGDQLVIFTDGVTEAGEDEDNQYSDERLEMLVVEKRRSTPQSLSRTIIADVDEFTANAPRSDDITMVIIKRDN
jgi:serine phosphatase RsbU (regulator of sigma subunit)